MCAKFLNGIEVAFKFLPGKQMVHLRVARATQPNYIAHCRAIEFPLVPLVMMACAGNQVMACQRFFTVADRTTPVHDQT
jgi:hypothetical protein